METMDKKEFAGQLLDNYGDNIFEETPKMEELNPLEKWLILKLHKTMNPKVAIESIESKVVEVAQLPIGKVEEKEEEKGLRKFDKGKPYTKEERLELAKIYLANTKKTKFSGRLTGKELAKKYGASQGYIYWVYKSQLEQGKLKNSGAKRGTYKKRSLKSVIESIAEQQEQQELPKEKSNNKVKRGQLKISVRMKAARMYRDRKKNGLSNSKIGEMMGMHGSYVPMNYAAMVKQEKIKA